MTQPAAQPWGPVGSAQPAPSPSASAQLDAHGEDLELGPSPAPAAPAQWDPAAAAAAQEAARAAMVAFARPDLPAEQWWEQLHGHLSAPAQGAYVNVDPRLVPCRLVQSAGPAQRAGSDLLAVVPIVTDAGTYEVLLSRMDGSSGWLVERLTPQA
ncbi:hypothetical protein [uncultured Cellulomonas sp.]|uniref:hypothetical protein n=1 Tax=uncultured Cellulomonas sp. TaxID=189682 RepID=UPI0026251BC9|nr:hypothetical protein [uncultured Cellulomonas sp.]